MSVTSLHPQNPSSRQSQAQRQSRPLSAAPLALPVLVDLSASGVPNVGVESVVPVAAKADVAQLGRLAAAVRSGGALGSVVGPDYRFASGRKHAPDAWLDPAVAVRRLGGAAREHGLVAALAVPHDGITAAASLAALARAQEWAGLDVRPAVDPFGVHRAEDMTEPLLREVSRAIGVGSVDARRRPALVAHADSLASAAHAGRYADVVRLSETDLVWARELRYAVRGAATAAGRSSTDVRVLVDVRVVVSDDRAAARERDLLLQALADPSAARTLAAVGTADDAVAELSRWVVAGSADGFVTIPGSLQADVSALRSGVLPEFGARHPRP